VLGENAKGQILSFCVKYFCNLRFSYLQ